MMYKLQNKTNLKVRSQDQEYKASNN